MLEHLDAFYVLGQDYSAQQLGVTVNVTFSTDLGTFPAEVSPVTINPGPLGSLAAGLCGDVVGDIFSVQLTSITTDFALYNFQIGYWDQKAIR
jgi:hypothetical protein